MNSQQTLTALAAEKNVDCEITEDGDTGYTITLATGEVEPAATFEDAVSIIRQYAA